MSRAVHLLAVLLLLPWLSGCWLFEDEVVAPPARQATVLPQTPPATPSPGTTPAGGASPVAPARDQRAETRPFNFAQTQGAVHPRVSLAAPREKKAASAPNAVPSQDERLAAIATDDRDFFAALEKNPGTWAEEERDRQAQALNNRYMDFLGDNRTNVEALILYGKFLRRVDERATAHQVFLLAHDIDPNIAVIDQQLANYFAEEGRFLSAYEYLQQAVDRAPNEPVYHYQMGELLNIYYDQFVADRILTPQAINAKITAEFSRAAELAPQEPRFAWRLAESYYDLRNPDWSAALAAWDALAKKASSDTEVEIIRLHRARVLIELGQFDEARPLVALPVHKALEGSRAQLVQRLEHPINLKAAVIPSPAAP